MEFQMWLVHRHAALSLALVMPGCMPGVPVVGNIQGADDRDKPGHDGDTKFVYRTARVNLPSVTRHAHAS
jgi:hypothetical protein